MSIGSTLAIAVIGGGVIGLTSAVRLLEAGYCVTVYAREITPHTTSDVAAAYWAPRRGVWRVGGCASGRWRVWALSASTPCTN